MRKFIFLLVGILCLSSVSALWWSGGAGGNGTVINNYYNITGSSYNITYENYNTSYGKFWYNQSGGVAGGSSYNETYAQWAYNQTFNATGSPQQVAIFTGAGGITGSQGLLFNSTTKQLTLNRNLADAGTPTIAGTAVRINCADNEACRLGITSYGIGAMTGFSGRTARGNGSVPTASQSGDILAQFDGYGRGATGWSLTPRAMMKVIASEAYTDSAQGGLLQFWTTPKGSLVPSISLIVDDGNITGNGNITSTGYFIGDGSRLTNISSYNISYNGLINNYTLPYLNLSGTNANQNINLGSYNLTATGIGIGLTTPVNALNVNGDGNFSGSVFVYNGIDLASFSAGQTLFLWNISTGLNDYLLMNETTTGGSPKRSYTRTVADNKYIVNWTTNTSGLFIGDYIPSGIYTLSINANSGVSGVRFLAEIYKRDAGGTETLLGTTGISAGMTGSEVTHNLVAYIPQTDITSTDRIVVKLKSYGVSTTSSYTFYTGGTTYSSLRLPSSSISKINFVTYSGATQNLNLGTYGLFAGFVNVTTAYIGNGYHWFLGSILREENGSVGNVTVGDGLYLRQVQYSSGDIISATNGATSGVINIFNFTATNVMNDFIVNTTLWTNDAGGSGFTCSMWLATNSSNSAMAYRGQMTLNLGGSLTEQPAYGSCQTQASNGGTVEEWSCRFICGNGCNYGTTYSINGRCDSGLDQTYKLSNIGVYAN